MRIKSIVSLVVISLSFLMTGCEGPVINGHSTGATIVCFGASLTQGIGADAGHDYPSYLRRMANEPVINAGVSGNTTSLLVQRLEQDVLQKNPKVVILTFGSNDLKHSIPKETTLKNVETIIDQIQKHGAMVVVVTFEPELLQASYFRDFRKLTIRKQALLVADVLNGISTDLKYMHDDVHPNNEGYRVVAQRIYKKIKLFLK